MQDVAGRRKEMSQRLRHIDGLLTLQGNAQPCGEVSARKRVTHCSCFGARMPVSGLQRSRCTGHVPPAEQSKHRLTTLMRELSVTSQTRSPRCRATDTRPGEQEKGSTDPPAVAPVPGSGP